MPSLDGDVTPNTLQALSEVGESRGGGRKDSVSGITVLPQPAAPGTAPTWERAEVCSAVVLPRVIVSVCARGGLCTAGA